MQSCAADPQPSFFRPTVLRSSALGETLSLGFCGFAAMSLAGWVPQMLQHPAVVGIVLADVWIAFQAVGGLAGKRRCPAVTMIMLIYCAVCSLTGIREVPGWLMAGPVSPLIHIPILMVILVTGYLDFRKTAVMDLSVKERRRFLSREILVALGVMWAVWSFLLPTISFIHDLAHPADDRVRLDQMSFVEHVGFRFGEGLVTLCFAAFGANIGSFLNVVVWRMPLGKSIVSGPSRCPFCATEISGKDNIPVFGWLRIGGHCRTCDAAIPARYPTVEALTAGLFLLFFFAELISGGATLPVRYINSYSGILWTIMYPKWDLIRSYLFHCFLIFMLITWAQMARDQKRSPLRLTLFAMIVAALSCVLDPGLVMIEPWQAGLSGGRVMTSADSAVMNLNSLVRSGLHTLLGAAAGTVAGLLLQAFNRWRYPGSFQRSSGENLLIGMLLIGISLGWQSVVSITAFALILSTLRSLILQTRPADVARPRLTVVLSAAVLHLLTWRLQWRIFEDL
jgi:leader peptidase (prepilin peptidase)/N-methyltransferase